MRIVRAAPLAFSSLVAIALGCGSSQAPGAPADAGADSPFAVPDSSGAAELEGGPEVDAAPRPRVTKHGGVLLPAPQVFAIYLTSTTADGGTTAAPSEDASLGWLLTSDYWTRLAEYGVHSGSFVGSTEVPLHTMIPASQISSGIIGQKDFANGVAHLLHPSPGAGTGVTIPSADVYAFFLPDGVNVVFPANQGTTCYTAAAYHDDDGIEAFAVFPPCGAGRAEEALAHELAETATDPFGGGWYSDADYANGGGEICDVCEEAVNLGSHEVAAFWSDAVRGCVP